MRAPVSLALGSVALLLAARSVPIVAQVRFSSDQAASPTHSRDAAIALRLSTLGLGFELGKQLVDHISVRLGANVGSFNKNGKEQSDITYDAHLKLKAVEALVDLYPGRRGNLHFTVGVLTNPITIRADGRPNASGTFTINDHTYTSAQVGTLSAEGKFPGAAPYFGLGFGTPARKGGRVKILFDLGASIGKPKLTLTATGAASNPNLQADLNSQRDKTQKDVNKYAKGYPVLSFGLAFHV